VYWVLQTYPDESRKAAWLTRSGSFAAESLARFIPPSLAESRCSRVSLARVWRALGDLQQADERWFVLILERDEA
jgi:hypothetical protein